MTKNKTLFPEWDFISPIIASFYEALGLPVPGEEQDYGSEEEES